MRRKLVSRLEAMDVRKDALLRLLSDQPPDRLALRPPSGGWNALDVVQHLVLVEEGVLGYAGKKRQGPPQPVPFLDRGRLGLLVAVLRSPLRFRAPAPQVVPAETLPLDGLRARWAEARRSLGAFVADLPDERLRALVFRHPIAGALDAAGTLTFLDEHVRHHEGQIRRTWEEAARKG
jgi:uncharacterized damage-inducible protein DinB